MSKTNVGIPARNTSRVIMILITTLCALSAAAQTGASKPDQGGSSMFSLHTASFTPGGSIPERYTCSGADVSPAIDWGETPQGTKSFALIVDDPDAPSGTFTHWVIYDIPAESKGFSQDVPKSERLDDGSLQGRNSFGRIGYSGPCPPPGKPHRYFFKLYALSTKPTLDPGATRQQLETAMKGRILAQTELMGTFKR
jgi:Raf kinase inhibitor-like YbhB/YbcL family protein